MRFVKFCLLGLTVVALAATSASADTFGFTNITNNSGQAEQVAPQLFVDVTDPGGGQVKFTFRNEGPIDSVITALYWDDGAGVLDSLDSLVGTAGVAFAAPANPANLPGGNALNPDFDADFSADADPPPATNGVDDGVGENIMAIFDLAMGSSFADVIAAIKQGFKSDGTGGDGLRIGIHVQSIGTSGQSDSFVATPEPSSVAMLAGAGMVLGAFFLRRRKG